MFREELIEAIIAEGKWRRAGTHYVTGGQLGGAAGVVSPALTIPGIAAGMAVSSSGKRGKAIRKLDQTKGTRADKVAAGKKFAKKRSITGAMVLPKNEYARKKLAKRGTAGHVGHGALRFVGGGPANTVRYANKVSYARSGFHRGNTPMFNAKKYD